MSQEKETSIINRWSMKQFFINMGKSLEIVTCTKKSGEKFKKLKFGMCYVAFSTKLGELTSKELNQMKDGLQVVELEVPEDIKAERKAKGYQEQSFRLCKAGSDARFENVELDWEM